MDPTQPITKYKIRTQTQPNPTHGLTQPMSISVWLYVAEKSTDEKCHCKFLSLY